MKNTGVYFAAHEQTSIAMFNGSLYTMSVLYAIWCGAKGASAGVSFDIFWFRIETMTAVLLMSEVIYFKKKI